MDKLKIVFLGNTKYSVISLQKLHQKFPVFAVVTKDITPNYVEDFALKEKILIIKANKLTSEVVAQIEKLQPDFLVVADFGLILPQKLLDLAKVAPLNIHHSLLPKYRGPSPAPFAILAGDKISGVSVIRMIAEVDAGDILGQEKYSFSDDETTDSALTALNKIGGELIVRVIEDFINGKVLTLAQNPKEATYSKMLTKEDGYFPIDNPPLANKLDRMVRAYFPWPGVWTKWNNKIVKFLPGGMIQMEGKKPVLLKDFLNGYPDFPITK